MTRKTRLREYRQNAGMTQVQLAEVAGIKQGHISLAENHGRGISLQNWCKLADLFNVDPRILAGWSSTEMNNEAERERETVQA